MIIAITKTCPCNIQRFFSEAKSETCNGKNDIFNSVAKKNCLWVHVRIACLLTRLIEVNSILKDNFQAGKIYGCSQS